MGCMRLSTLPDRDEERSLAVLHAALAAGVRLFDTADVYCRDGGERGHNERLLARALQGWKGDRTRVEVATKGGLTRPDGRWVPDGRARHLIAACEASRRALGVDQIDLYQLHAPDPRTPLRTSLRALASLKRAGSVAGVGLCNVGVRQIQEALAETELAAVQVELSCLHDDNIRNGVAAFCIASGIRLLAYRPLGGPAGRRRIERDPLLAELAQRHGASPCEIALAWLRDFGPLVVPLPGPTQPATVASIVRSRGVSLGEADRARLDERFPAGRLLRVPPERRRPTAQGSAEVVLVIGLPGAGKSTLAQELVAKGYARLNRDEAGGRLDALVPVLERAIVSGQRRVVLDNTYATRRSRSPVIEMAFRHGLPVRCLWLQTSLEDAQLNAVSRTLRRYGRLLGPEEMRAASRRDPGLFPPNVLFRYQRTFEPPDAAEGFSSIEAVPFDRRRAEASSEPALIFWYDGVLRRSRRGLRTPRTPDDVEILPGRAEALRGHAERGFRIMGLAWHPELASGATTPEALAACYARTHELLGVEIEALYCPHGDGPPVCWCRKPLPGLGAVLLARHGLDAARCQYVGTSANDRAFARRLGFEYRDGQEFFEGRASAQDSVDGTGKRV
jgi:aryl-alcohol dehydrogenase-like predicted oxidoreductase/histidinol phosphatase-like enzyme